MNQTVFIIDTYDPFFSRLVKDSIRYKFRINDIWYVVREVSLDWGQPELGPRPIEEDAPPSFNLFQSFEAAMMFVREMKRINEK